MIRRFSVFYFFSSGEHASVTFLLQTTPFSLPPSDIITFLVVDLSHLNQLSKGPLDCDLVSTLLPCFAELLTV